MKVEVSSRSALDKYTQAEISVSLISHGPRMMRGIKALAIAWILAIFFILVPVLHFVLVPAAFITGIVLFLHYFGLRHYLEVGAVICPSCDTEFKLKPNAFNLPIRELCPHCRADVLITLSKS
jgi:hypothetical protein